MIFQVNRGSFFYTLDRPILKGVSFSAGAGDVVAVLGPNGAGKTTLLRCMMGLLPWRTGGSLLDGVDIRSIPVRTLWQSLAYVPQARGMNFSYTAQEMVLLGRSSRVGMLRQPSREDESKAREAMEAMGIDHLRETSCSRMSGGELQMVLIARALAAEPRVLVLDEPESNLDYKNQLVVLDVIKRLAEEKGLCVVFNTHYPAHALRIAGKSLLLDGRGGSVFGTSPTVITKETMRSSFSVNVHIDRLHVERRVYDLVLPLNLV